MRKIARLNVAIGGFLIFTSLILVGLILLIFLNLIDIDVLSSTSISPLLTLIFLAFGILDIIAGIILIWNR